MDIADLNLSVRAFNAVCRASIKTIPELYHKYQLEPEQLHREIGQKHTQEVGDALAKHLEEVCEENRRAEAQEPLKPGDYLPDYDCELWGEAVTFDELTQMVGQLVIVNDSWYPEDDLEEDGEGDVLLVTDADGDIVHLRGDTPKIYEITRLAMDDSVKTRYCTKVWKVKGSEAADMIEETKSTVIVSGDYTRAVALTRSIIANAQAVQQSLYEVCKGLKEMRDGKLYKELGYANFEDYTENEVGIKHSQAAKYVSIASVLTDEISTRVEQIGVTKLALLAKLDEPTREAITEAVDVENATVKELREQIAALQSAKESAEADAAQAKESIDSKTKQFHAALASKDAEIEEVRSGWKRRSDTLLEKIRMLNEQIKELEDRPIEHDVVDHTEELETLRGELDAANAALADAQKRLAERPMVQDALPVTDTTDAFKAYLSAAADAMRRLLEFVAKRPNDVNHALYLSRIDGVLNLSNTELAKLKGES